MYLSNTHTETHKHTCTSFYCVLHILICTSWRCMATLHLHYFPKSICSVNVSVSYLLTFKIFQTLLWLKYLLWWSVINSLCYCCNCCYCCNEQHGLCPGETASFTDKCMCSDCSTHQLFPIILPLLKSPYCLSYSNIEIRPMNNLTVASTWSGDRKSCTSLALTENLKMIALTEEDMCKAETDWKLDLLYQTTKLLMERKSHWRKLPFQWTHRW